MKEPQLVGEFDAQVWAEEFLRVDRERNIHADEGTLLAWFSTAIMAGYDRGVQDVGPRRLHPTYTEERFRMKEQVFIVRITHDLVMPDDLEGAIQNSTLCPEGVSVERVENPQTGEIRIVLDGPPSHEAGRFVEVEDAEGRGIKVGEWHERPNGWWELRINAEETP